MCSCWFRNRTRQQVQPILPPRETDDGKLGLYSRSASPDFSTRNEGPPHLGAHEIKQQRTSDSGTYRTPDEMPHEDAHQVSQDLDCDDDDSELPSPKAACKPTTASSHQGGAKHQKRNAHCSSKRRKLLVGGCVQSPHVVEKGALPNQRRSRQTGHDGPNKEQENPNRCHCPWRLSSHIGHDSRGMTASHELTIAGTQEDGYFQNTPAHEAGALLAIVSSCLGGRGPTRQTCVTTVGLRAFGPS